MEVGTPYKETKKENQNSMRKLKSPKLYRVHNANTWCALFIDRNCVTWIHTAHTNSSSYNSECSIKSAAFMFLIPKHCSHVEGNYCSTGTMTCQKKRLEKEKEEVKNIIKNPT